MVLDVSSTKVLALEARYDDLWEPVGRCLELLAVDWAGKKVVVKPNALRPAPPEAAVTTHPALIAMLVRQLRHRGATVVVGDNPGGGMRHGDNRNAFLQTGLLQAAAGAYANFASDPVAVQTDHHACDQVVISRPILEADILISVPKFKTHGLTGLTGGMKNSYGFIPGDQKGQIHFRSRTPHVFAEAVVEVFSIRPPDLVIVDAVVGMQGNGPNSRDLIYLGRLLASTDAVAVDRVMAHMMGLEVSMLRTITRAAECGLGQAELGLIEVEGDISPIEGFRLPPRFESRDPEILHREREGGPGRQRHLPVADPDRCDLCLTCVDVCPADALQVQGSVPVVVEQRCVTCYCCQELCPRAAIETRQQPAET